MKAIKKIIKSMFSPLQDLYRLLTCVLPYLCLMTLKKEKINIYLYFSRKFLNNPEKVGKIRRRGSNKSSESLEKTKFDSFGIPKNELLERNLYSLIEDFNHKLSTRNRKIKFFSNFSEFAKMVRMRNYSDFFNRYYNIDSRSRLGTDATTTHDSSKYLKDYFHYQYLTEMDRIPSLFEVRMFKEVLVKFNNLSYEDQLLFLKLLLEYERFRISMLEESEIEQSNTEFDTSSSNLEILEDLLLEYQYEMSDPTAVIQILDQKKAYEQKVENSSSKHHIELTKKDVEQSLETKRVLLNEKFSEDFNPIS